MLKKIRIRNFKCYGPRGVDFNLSKINFIFGENSAGKSTFLQFLSKLGEGLLSDGSCDKTVFDGLQFKKNGDAIIEAKFRVANNRVDGSTTDNVLSMVFDIASGRYRLLDDKAMPIASDRYRDILNYKHVPTTRKSDKKTSETSSFQSSFINQIRLERSKERQEIVDDILSRLKIDYSCTEKTLSPDEKEIEIHDKVFGINIPVSEVGTGIEGLIELALILSDWKDGIRALEEPETNVNEAQMAALAQVLVEEAMKRDNAQLIVECHSKLMALKLIELVHHGKLVCYDPRNGLMSGNLSVIAVKKTSEGSKAETANIDSFGNVNWPGGFFPSEGRMIRKSLGVPS